MAWRGGLRSPHAREHGGGGICKNRGGGCSDKKVDGGSGQLEAVSWEASGRGVQDGCGDAALTEGGSGGRSTSDGCALAGIITGDRMGGKAARAGKAVGAFAGSGMAAGGMQVLTDSGDGSNKLAARGEGWAVAVVAAGDGGMFLEEARCHPKCRYGVCEYHPEEEDDFVDEEEVEEIARLIVDPDYLGRGSPTEMDDEETSEGLESAVEVDRPDLA